MRLVFVSVLCAGAMSVPAFADPLAISPDAYAASQSADAAMAAQDAPVSQQRYAQASQPRLGGGFIEFLFGGAAGQQALPPPQGSMAGEPSRDYVSAQPNAALSDPSDQQADAPAPQGYAPSSQGDMAQGQIDPKFNRQEVAYDGKEAPGTIIIDTPDKFLLLVEESGKAMRYGIGVGRPGFTWAGVKTITAKREWPDWRPPDDMIKRQPSLPRFMAGGPENPLGARAMYLGSTLYRIHGSNEPWTIGTNVSSGCIRLRNADVIDLYSRVKVGTKVVVI